MGFLAAALYTFPLTVIKDTAKITSSGTINVRAFRSVKYSHIESISATFKKYPATIPARYPMARMTRNSKFNCLITSAMDAPNIENSEAWYPIHLAARLSPLKLHFVAVA